MKLSNLPPFERLHQLLEYSAETGEFRWKYQADRRKTWNTRFAGKLAGHLARGRVTIRIDGQLCFANRVAWLMSYGSIPNDRQVDHRNTNAADNRLSNLRLATNAQNAWNGPKRAKNASGFKGVSWSVAGNCWRARLMKGGKEVLCKYFDTPEQAHAAYVHAANDHFGEFARAA